MRILGTVAAAALLVASPLFAYAGEVAKSGDISYVTGGAGGEERDKLDAMSGQFNLKLTYAMQNGDYAAEVNVRIIDAQGNALITTVTEGPFLYAQLPPGTYTVESTLKGQTQKQSVQVASGKQTEAKITWPGA